MELVTTLMVDHPPQETSAKIQMCCRFREQHIRCKSPQSVDYKSFLQQSPSSDAVAGNSAIVLILLQLMCFICICSMLCMQNLFYTTFLCTYNKNNLRNIFRVLQDLNNKTGNNTSVLSLNLVQSEKELD